MLHNTMIIMIITVFGEDTFEDILAAAKPL